MDYIKDGDEIYRRSFAIIRSEADLSMISPELEKTAVRMIHAAGDTSLGPNIIASNDLVKSARLGLNGGAPILCDTMMVARGITKARLPANNEIICTLQTKGTQELAIEIGNTRTAAAINFWEDKIEGAIVVIGNAPTALFRLLELIDKGWPKPAAILGLPVGFVGAVESKDELASNPRGIPFITLKGRRGGSAIAVAALNALAQERE